MFICLFDFIFIFCLPGHTLGIPDSVMGLTFLAAGTSIPEAVSSVIVARQGEQACADYLFVQQEIVYYMHNMCMICRAYFTRDVKKRLQKPYSTMHNVV